MKGRPIRNRWGVGSKTKDNLKIKRRKLSLKKLIVLLLAVSLMLSMGISASAAVAGEDATSSSIENCGDGCSLIPPVIDSISPQDRNPPRAFYNIAQNGKYRGNFSGLTSTMYTLKYFDTKNGLYCVRVKTTDNTSPSIKYNVKNYCVTCRRVVETSGQYKTASGLYGTTGWQVIQFRVPSGHSGHFFAPAIQNLGDYNGYGSFNGTIEVNYTNNW